jgi:hypothetical protein
MTTAIGIDKLISLDEEMKPQAISIAFGLPVFVIFTSIDHALHALEKASQLARPLKSGIEIVVAQTVPFALPLDDPSVPFEFLVKRLKEMAVQFPEHVKISAYLCRDLLEVLKRTLNRNCLIVMGVRKSWWPTHDERVARELRRAGYNVILVETE